VFQVRQLFVGTVKGDLALPKKEYPVEMKKTSGISWLMRMAVNPNCFR